MADWKVVRYDPTYEEKLDPEIIPLCEALNSAGFVTISSCCGHGQMWPYICFEHSSDERIESLARFVLKTEQFDYWPHFSVFQKDILLEGYRWSVAIHLNNVYSDTPTSVAVKEAELALAKVTQAVDAWRINMAGGPHV